MSGCPYLKSVEFEDCEYCTCTKKPTNDALLCDFDYDEKCEIFKRQIALEQRIAKTLKENDKRLLAGDCQKIN